MYFCRGLFCIDPVISIGMICMCEILYVRRLSSSLFIPSMNVIDRLFATLNGTQGPNFVYLFALF